ncbi:hypothetical protein AS594_22430 [Streptomyces agglomeratus]|uniref:Uncharacterized protein n=1 Tax=Streptomyces agglomeratus TaxID=285458 RepID=A0A1E5PBB6_9ACTN|nr:hypothetical protein [Streptomyces agglomeratus]OEJ26830.1 hypothetical protein AS594_22430 [Streptomyces agglomeratus]
MFEIRVICTDSDIPAVTEALSMVFTTGAVRQSKTFDGTKTRLYITAEHRPQAWPTPEAAYATAPSIISEIGWTAERAREALWPIGPQDVREFWLRKAAVLDRIALSEADGRGLNDPSDAAEVATEAARRLLDVDSGAGLASSGTGGPYTPDHPDSIRDPRGYVRQEYAIWQRNQ